MRLPRYGKLLSGNLERLSDLLDEPRHDTLSPQKLVKPAEGLGRVPSCAQKVTELSPVESPT